MENLIICFNAVAPLFCMLLLGCLARRMGVLQEESADVVMAVAYKLLLFFLVFNGIATVDIGTALRPGAMLFVGAGMLAAALLSLPVMLRLEPERRSCAVLVESSFHVNYVIMAAPIITSLMGEANAAPAYAMAVVVVPLENIMAVLVLTRFNGGKLSVGKILLDILKNPLVLGCLAAFGVLLLDVRLPDFVMSTAGQLSGACTPLCLLCLGATIRFDDARACARRIAIATVTRLVAVPAVMIPLAILLGFRGTDLAVITLAFSSSVAATAFPVCRQLGGDSKLIANVIVFTSLLACFTIFLYTFVLKELALI